MNNDTDARLRRAEAIDAARDAIAEAEAEGLPAPSIFLHAARAAAALVGDNEGGIIAGRLLGLLDSDNMPTRRAEDLDG